jgi:hypothetical protein
MTYIVTDEHMRAYAAEQVAAERERILAIARSRADYERELVSAYVNHYPALERYITRHAAMRDLIDAITDRIEATGTTPT